MPLYEALVLTTPHIAVFGGPGAAWVLEVIEIQKVERNLN